VEQLREEKASAVKRKLEEEEEGERGEKRLRRTMLSKANEELVCTICDEIFISVTLNHSFELRPATHLFPDHKLASTLKITT